MNDQNIKPYEFTSDQSREEAVKNGRNGGKASGRARLAKRQLRELAESFGNMSVSDKDKLIMESLGIKPSEMTRKMQMVISLYNKAMKGDVAAFNAVRDILGEKPTENMAVSLPNTVEVRIIQAQRNDFASSESEITD